ERALYGHIHLTGEPVLVIGAGDITVNLLREMERSSQWRAVGILDDDTAWHGQVLLGVKVLGGLGEVSRWARQLESRHAIISLPASSAGVRRRAAEVAAAAGLTVLTVPSYDDLLSGRRFSLDSHRRSYSTPPLTSTYRSWRTTMPGKRRRTMSSGRCAWRAPRAITAWRNSCSSRPTRR